MLGSALWPLVTTILGFEASGELDGVRYRLLAPDWIWQGQAVNVLLSAWRDAGEAGQGRSGGLRFTIEPPAGAFAAPLDAPRVFSLAPPAGEARRGAFIGWVASAHVPLGAYAFGLTVEAEGGEMAGPPAPVRLSVPVEIIRGQAVPPGRLAIIVPGIVALLATLGIGRLLSRWAGRGFLGRAGAAAAP